MILRLHGFSASNYYNIVKLALLEKGVPFEEVTIYTGAGPKYRPDYLARSVLGKVPCLETDEGFLSESRCIVATSNARCQARTSTRVGLLRRQRCSS